MSEKKTKLVPINEDDLEKLREIANTIGVPLRELISRIFRDGASLALLSGGRLHDVETEYKALKELGRIGFALIPVSTLNKLLHNSNALREAKEDAKEVGKGIGTLYRISGLVREEHIVGFIKAIMPDSSQINIKQERDLLVITVVAIARSKESISISTSMIEGFLESLGYKCINKEITNGLLVAYFEKQST